MYIILYNIHYTIYVALTAGRHLNINIKIGICIMSCYQHGDKN